MGRRREPRMRDQREELDERVLDITRVAKVIKGGRRFAFRTVVVVGDNRGRVGVGVGKARAVPDSIRKAVDRARRELIRVPMVDTTIPHPIETKYSGAIVMLRPAAPGTGVVAGGAVRAVCEAAGIQDILTKSKGSANMLNVARATMQSLQNLHDIEELAEMRQKDPEDILPFWLRGERTEE